MNISTYILANRSQKTCEMRIWTGCTKQSSNNSVDNYSPEISVGTGKCLNYTCILLRISLCTFSSQINVWYFYFILKLHEASIPRTKEQPSYFLSYARKIQEFHNLSGHINTLKNDKRFSMGQRIDTGRIMSIFELWNKCQH